MTEQKTEEVVLESFEVSKSGVVSVRLSGDGPQLYRLTKEPDKLQFVGASAMNIAQNECKNDPKYVEGFAFALYIRWNRVYDLDFRKIVPELFNIYHVTPYSIIGGIEICGGEFSLMVDSTPMKVVKLYGGILEEDPGVE